MLHPRPRFIFTVIIKLIRNWFALFGGTIAILWWWTNKDFVVEQLRQFCSGSLFLTIMFFFFDDFSRVKREWAGLKSIHNEGKFEG